MNWGHPGARSGRLGRIVLTFAAALGFTVLGTSAFIVPSASAALPGLTTGFANAPLLTFTGDPTRAVWLSKAAADGAGLVRVPFTWSSVAPSSPPPGFDASNPGDPNYNWTSLDSAVEDITSHGMGVVLLPYQAPTWAQGANRPNDIRDGTWKPNAAQFGDFATALAKRYNGNYPDPAHVGQFLPRVSFYQAWNEPNLGYYLNPQWQKTGTGYVEVSTNIYRPMLNAFYSAVKAVNPSDVVLSGGTAPYGDTGPLTIKGHIQPPMKWRVAPLIFYRALFCVNQKLKKVSCTGPVHLDAVDNHPYVLLNPPNSPTEAPQFPNDVDIANEYKLGQVLSAGERVGTVLPAGQKQIWASEISWATNPPKPSPFAVSPATQAVYAEQAMYLLWRQHVSKVMWLDIRDLSSSIKTYNPFYFGALYFYSGAPKPSVTAFWFPFVTHRVSKTKIQAWGRAPAGGTLKIERQKAGKWVTVAKFAVATHQVFEKTLSSSGAQKFRAQVGSDTSLGWSQSG